MRFHLTCLLVAVLTIIGTCFTQNPSFAGVSAGQTLSSLPFVCRDTAVFCDAELGGSHVRINSLDSRVLMFDVIYEGKTFTGSSIAAPPISLSQAIQRHSLQQGLGSPMLRLALDKSGAVWGLVDVANRITYKTKTDPSKSGAQVGSLQVVEVGYLSDDAPILKRSNTRDFGTLATQLVASARTVSPYSAEFSGERPPADAASGNRDIAEAITPEELKSQPPSGHTGGPFGLERGMTKAQVIKLLGNSAIEKNADDYLALTSLPKGHPSFKHYILKFSPDAGLLKIGAMSEPVESDAYGEALKTKFEEIQRAITNTYGDGKNLDYLKQGSIWIEPREWMMSLTKNERTLASYWEPKRNGISGVVLECKGAGTDSGYLVLTYEFDGWNEYVDQINRKKDSVF